MNKILSILFLFSIPGLANITVQGHRGARAILPENTLSAMKYAINVGVDVLEFDLAVTKDHHLILSHDPTLNEDLCFDPNGIIASNTAFYSLTLKQVKTLVCGTKVNPNFKNQKISSGETIATLDEIFQWAKSLKKDISKKIQFNIETKIYPYSRELTPTPKAFAKLLVDKINEYKMQDKVIIQSFDYRTLKWVKFFAPKIKISQLIYGNFFDFSLAAENIKAEWVSPNFKWLNKTMVEHLHQKKLKVSTWTLNTEEQWNYAISMGVDSIITDDPKKLINYLTKKGLRIKP